MKEFSNISMVQIYSYYLVGKNVAFKCADGKYLDIVILLDM